MLLFDAFHDEYRGVICMVEIIDGHLRKGDRVVASSTGDTYDILEV
jgi:translation elongation factor EF-4